MNRLSLLRYGAPVFLALLMATAASAQEGRWNEHTPPAAPEAEASPAIDLPDVWTEGALTFYADRNTFYAANNGLAIEDFEDVNAPPGAGCNSPSPVDSNTNNSCFGMGDIMPGITIAANGPAQNQPDAIVAIGEGTFGSPSIIVGAAYFVDATELRFDPGVHAVGADTYGGYAGSPSVMEVYDTAGTFLGAVTFTAQGFRPVFIGVSSDVATIGSVLFRRVNPNTPNVLLDNIAFGTPTDCEQSMTATLDDDTPAPGDVVTFSVTVTNNAGSPAPLDLWLDARGPFLGNTIDRQIRLGSGTVPAGATVTRNVTLRVPAAAPDGLYGWDLHIGDFATGEICDSEHFFVEVITDQIGSRTHDTGLVQFEVFEDGRLGRIAGYGGTGFRFDGENGLYESVVLVGQSPSQVSGQYFDDLDSEWAPVAPFQTITPPSGFDEAYRVAFDDSAAPDPIGLEVTERSYSDTGDAFVVVDLDVTNTTGGTLTGIHVGIFADWDVPDFDDNLAGYDAGTQLLYVYDEDGFPSSNYFGVAALDGMGGVTVSGLDYTSLPGFPPAGGNDADLYDALTTIDAPPATAGDLRPVIGVGPYTIGAGETVNVKFAFVGGTSEADIIANAAAAQASVSIATATAADAAETAPAAVAPNPFARQATISYEVAEVAEVRLSVYDVLGREVAVLVDGRVEAGAHRALFDADGLAAGTYLWRLAVGGEVQTGRMTLAR